MTLTSAIVVYLITWWTVLFAVLPWGNRPPDQPAEGHATSAPANPRLLRKFIITTLISAIVFAIIFVVVDTGLISFRDWAAQSTDR